VLFFFLLAGDAGRGVDEVTLTVHEQLTAAGIPTSDQAAIVAGLRECVQDRSAATDPTTIPPSCQAVSALASAGERANSYNFTRTFGFTLWYAVGMLVLVLIGLFALPRRVRTRDLDAELAPAPADQAGGQEVPSGGTVGSIR
jgi:hypothetical protein